MSNQSIVNADGEIQEYQEQGQALAVQVEAAKSRQLAEVEGQMVMARRFPRVVPKAYAQILEACKRKRFAETAIYSYPRGGGKVTGPSIRMAEVLAQNWGNIDFGVVEIEQRFGESTMMAYAWDLETNVKQTKIFQVKHERYTRAGSKQLTDPRDIYELVANQGARRVRNCILGVIPGDIVEDALDQCRTTMRSSDDNMPIGDRVRKMVASFSDLGVTVEQLERFVDSKVETMTEKHVIDLKDVYRSITQKSTQPSDWFKPEKPKAETLDDVVDAEVVEEKPKAKGKK